MSVVFPRKDKTILNTKCSRFLCLHGRHKLPKVAHEVIFYNFLHSFTWVNTIYVDLQGVLGALDDKADLRTEMEYQEM